MTRLRLKIEGRPKQLTMDSFSDVIKQSRLILRELDRAVTREKRGTLEWVVSELGVSSLYIEAESRVVRGEEDFAEQIASKFVEGISKICQDVATPPLFSVDSVNGLLRIVRILKRSGDQFLNVSLPDLEKRALLMADSEPRLVALRGVSRKVLGAVEGRLELVSIHRPYRRFNVYHSITDKAIKCTLPEEMEQTVIQSLGKRVAVSGTVAYNTLGEPLNVEVSRIRPLSEREALPSIDDVLGIAPDFTGDLSTEDYLRSLRVG